MVQETKRERTHLPQKIFTALSGGTAAQTFEVRERFDNETLRLIRRVCFVPGDIFSNFNPLDTTCLVPRRLSLSMKMCAQKKAGRRQLFPSHGSLRFITSQSRFALDSTMRKTKRLSRKLGFDCITEKISSTPKVTQGYPAHPDPFILDICCYSQPRFGEEAKCRAM